MVYIYILLQGVSPTPEWLSQTPPDQDGPTGATQGCEKGASWRPRKERRIIVSTGGSEVKVGVGVEGRGGGNHAQ